MVHRLFLFALLLSFVEISRAAEATPLTKGQSLPWLRVSENKPTPDQDGDWILVLDDVAKNFPPPGK